MVALERLKKLLNGGGKAAGPKALRIAITEIESEQAATRREIEQIPAKRAEATLADDAEKQIAKLRSRENELYDTLEISEGRLALLRERLNELIVDERQADVIEYRKQIFAKGEQLLTALRHAQTVFQEFILHRKAFAAAGFRVDAERAPLAPGIFNLAAGGQLQVELFEKALTAYYKTENDPPLKQIVTRVAPDFDHHFVTPLEQVRVLPHGDMTHGVRLYETPAPPGDVKRVAAPLPATRAQDDVVTRFRKPRPQSPLPEVPLPGMVRCRVLKSGYPDGEGRLLLYGDLIDVAEQVAFLAVANGAVEFVEPAASGEASP